MRLAGIFPPHLTEWRSNRYYNSSPMRGSGLHTYAPLLLHLLIAVVLAGALTTVSVLVGWRRPSRAKQQAYECGMEPTGDARAHLGQVLPRSDGFHFVRRGSYLPVPLGLHLSQFAVVRLRGDDALHSHPVGRLSVSLEKGRAGLA